MIIKHTLDGEGNPLANSSVTFNINGVFYTRISDDNGFATLNINLNPGEYIITTYAPNGLSIGNNITVLPTLSGENIVKYRW